MAGKRKAPYMHTDGSDCYTKNCSLDHATNVADQNRAIRDEFERKLDELIRERDSKLAEWQIPDDIYVAPEQSSAPTVLSDDARVQNGEVLNEVTVDGTVYHRRRDGVYADWPYSMRFQANRPISESEARKMAQIIGYNYRATVAGESLGDPEMDSPYSFTVYSDTTKTRRDDLGIAMEEFEDNFDNMIQEGSPVRKTDRAGQGTKNTRLVDGFNDPSLKVEIYYDSIIK